MLCQERGKFDQLRADPSTSTPELGVAPANRGLIAVGVTRRRATDARLLGLGCYSGAREETVSAIRVGVRSCRYENAYGAAAAGALVSLP